MFKSNSFKKVMELGTAISNVNECIEYFYQSGNLEEVEAYKAIVKKLYKQLVAAKKAHQQSNDELVYSC